MIQISNLRMNSTFHTPFMWNNQTWKQLNSINVPKKVTPTETTQDSQLLTRAKPEQTKPSAGPKGQQAARAKGLPSSSSHLVTQIWCKSKSYSSLKGIIPPSSPAVTNVYLRSITQPGHPKSKRGHLKKNKNIANGLGHLNSKLAAEGQGKPTCYFPEDPSSTVPTTTWLRTKKVTSQGPSDINLCISTLQHNYEGPGQGHPVA